MQMFRSLIIRGDEIENTAKTHDILNLNIITVEHTKHCGTLISADLSSSWRNNCLPGSCIFELKKK